MIGSINKAISPLAVTAALLFSVAQVAKADGNAVNARPRIIGTLLVEFQNDNRFDSDAPTAKFSDLYNTMELGLGLFLNPYFSAHGILIFEPVRPPRGNRVFEDHGLFVEELYLQINPINGLRIIAGKFNPIFGIAWDKAPGIYGVDFAEDYEIRERLGFGAVLTREKTSIGTMEMSTNIYTADTTELSNSHFTRRGRTRVSDGGAGNTAKLDSFNVALDGSNIPGLPGLEWHAAYHSHRRGKTVDDIGHQQGIALGMHGWSKLGENLNFEWLSEFAIIDNVGGRSRDKIHYYTLGGVLTLGRYNIAASYTGRPRQISGGDDFDDKLMTVSAGVELYRGWTLDAAYKFHVENDLPNHTVGMLFAKEFVIER